MRELRLDLVGCMKPCREFPLAAKPAEALVYLLVEIFTAPKYYNNIIQSKCDAFPGAISPHFVTLFQMIGPLAFSRSQRGSHTRRGSCSPQACDRHEELLSIARWRTKLSGVALRQVEQNFGVDLAVAKCRFVLLTRAAISDARAKKRLASDRGGC